MKDFQNTFEPIPLNSKKESFLLWFFAGIGIASSLVMLYLLLDTLIRGL